MFNISKEESVHISDERKKYLKDIKIKSATIFLTQIFILAAVFVLWEILARAKVIDSFITSQPTRIIDTIINLYNEGDLFSHIGVTCLETIIGFILSTVLGTVVATILWWSEFLSRVFEPYLVVLNSLPKIALGPVFIVWIGAGPASIIVMALAISIVVTILEVLNGFLAVDKEKIKLIKSFGGNKLQIFFKLVFPASFPSIVSALKINVGLSWVGVIVGEFLVSKAGIGYLIVYGGQVFKLDLVMTSVIILGIAASLMYQVVSYIEKKLIIQKSQ